MKILTYKEAVEQLKTTKNVFIARIDRAELAPYRTKAETNIKSKTKRNYKMRCKGVRFCPSFVETFNSFSRGQL